MKRSRKEVLFGRKKRRLVIIGLDGMPYRLIKHLAQDNIMPNMNNLISQGVLRQMASSIPEVSAVAWSSIITGVNPAKHSIFGFTEIAPASYRLSFPNFTNLKSTPFWQLDTQRRAVIINVPFTYPATSLNGVMISGFVALDLEKATYPVSLVPTLQKLDYRIDVDSQKAHSSLELFLKDLSYTLKARLETYRYLWDSIDWDTFMLVFTGTDRLAHFLWHAYEDPFHIYHQAFLEYLQRIDTAIGEISTRIAADEPLIILSDHGFEQIEKNVYINSLFKKEGFLKLKNSSSPNYSDIDHGTKAFALDPGRIYIHLKEKYPRGSVEPIEYDKIITELETFFSGIEAGGKKIISRVYRKEELFTGPLFQYAPDLVLLPQPGFNLKASLKSKELFGKDIFTGKHTQHDAFLLIRAPYADDIMPINPSVFDITGIIKALTDS
jgi:predicted AlkP superfamily phosphohydrolase/phosphomutase